MRSYPGVVICLKIRTFVVSATTYELTPLATICCDLLENSYLCGISNNNQRLECREDVVVICLKIRTFVVSATTRSQASLIFYRLWFAWKFVPLWYQQQLVKKFIVNITSCDLLENSYLCGISNNIFVCHNSIFYVVICLKIRTFVVSATTLISDEDASLCCDLLENSYLCGISNNGRVRSWLGWLLWFAWKFVPLWYQQQPLLANILRHFCCDLLENSYLCGISNNKNMIVFLDTVLWFAWKFVPLWYQQQLYLLKQRWIVVVICLKIRTFVVSATTY